MVIPWEELTKNQVGFCLMSPGFAHWKKDICPEWQAVCRRCEKKINHTPDNRPVDLTLCQECEMLMDEAEMGLL